MLSGNRADISQEFHNIGDEGRYMATPLIPLSSSSLLPSKIRSNPKAADTLFRVTMFLWLVAFLLPTGDDPLFFYPREILQIMVACCIGILSSVYVDSSLGVALMKRFDVLFLISQTLGLHILWIFTEKATVNLSGFKYVLRVVELTLTGTLFSFGIILPDIVPNFPVRSRQVCRLFLTVIIITLRILDGLNEDGFITSEICTGYWNCSHAYDVVINIESTLAIFYCRNLVFTFFFPGGFTLRKCNISFEQWTDTADANAAPLPHHLQNPSGAPPNGGGSETLNNGGPPNSRAAAAVTTAVNPLVVSPGPLLVLPPVVVAPPSLNGGSLSNYPIPWSLVLSTFRQYTPAERKLFIKLLVNTHYNNSAGSAAVISSASRHTLELQGSSRFVESYKVFLFDSLGCVSGTGRCVRLISFKPVAPALLARRLQNVATYTLALSLLGTAASLFLPNTGAFFAPRLILLSVFAVIVLVSASCFTDRFMLLNCLRRFELWFLAFQILGIMLMFLFFVKRTLSLSTTEYALIACHYFLMWMVIVFALIAGDVTNISSSNRVARSSVLFGLLVVIIVLVVWRFGVVGQSDDHYIDTTICPIVYSCYTPRNVIGNMINSCILFTSKHFIRKVRFPSFLLFRRDPIYILKKTE